MKDHPDPELIACKKALSHRLLDALTLELRSPRPASRRKALLRLGNLRPLAPFLLSQVENLLADPDFRVRKAANKALIDLNQQRR
jgi:HEAT repeat protein